MSLTIKSAHPTPARDSSTQGAFHTKPASPMVPGDGAPERGAAMLFLLPIVYYVHASLDRKNQARLNVLVAAKNEQLYALTAYSSCSIVRSRVV